MNLNYFDDDCDRLKHTHSVVDNNLITPTISPVALAVQSGDVILVFALLNDSQDASGSGVWSNALRDLPRVAWDIARCSVTSLTLAFQIFQFPKNLACLRIW